MVNKIGYCIVIFVSSLLSYLFGNRIIFPELLEVHSIGFCVLFLGFMLVGIFGLIKVNNKFLND